MVHEKILVCPKTYKRQILDNCISENQLAFLAWRQILDNVVVAHEYTHCINNLRKGQKKFVALKLDLANAYNRVEYRFLGNVMIRMGFDLQFTVWISRRVQSTSFSFNINGEAHGILDHLEAYDKEILYLLTFF